MTDSAFRRPPPRRPAGFAYIAAIVLLIVVAGLALAMVRLSATQQNTANGALLVARASQAARGGIEWMFYQVGSKGLSGCPNDGSKQTLNDFKSTGFLVTVECSYQTYNEGDDTTLQKNILTLKAVACNGSAASCPDNNSAAQPDYTERRRVATACIQTGGSLGDCY